MGRVEYWHDPAAPKANSLTPAAGVLAVDSDSRLLLIRRSDTGQWAIPMGKQELGETIAQCARRETAEETGVDVEIDYLLGVFTDPAHIVAYTDGEVRQEWELTFVGRPISGSPTINDEATDVRWFTASQLHDIDIHPTMRRQLDVYLSGAVPQID